MTSKQISDAESILMEVLWQKGEATAAELREAVVERTGWQEGTVKALLNRLLNKGAIAAEREGRRFRYRPVVDRTTYVSEQSDSLLDRLFDGRIAPLVEHFHERDALTRADVEELRKLIDAMEDREPGNGE